MGRFNPDKPAGWEFRMVRVGDGESTFLFCTECNMRVQEVLKRVHLASPGRHNLIAIDTSRQQAWDPRKKGARC